ncbi:MAG: Dolichol-phosphate mannosyltransferase [Fibrobacteria bacterium]|jgi:dolichol-phosphate mannosyltransferase|nr:Dolichol-phosphate mannosyltransferase [Fibrobacteria bacterium]
MSKTLIIIPTYNEIENLPRMIPALESLNLGLEILVVDDGSPDGTGAWVRGQQASKPHLHLIERSGKQGLGSAYVRGFRYALEKNYDYVFEMDADFSHDPAYIADFLEAIRDADLVIGSRYINGVNVVNWPMSRLLLSYFANMYARWITGMPVRDATGGFKCFRVSALRRLDLDAISSGGYSFQIEVNYKLWKKGCRLQEIPIIFKDRTAGTSKMSGGIIREALFLLVRLRLGGGR